MSIQKVFKMITAPHIQPLNGESCRSKAGILKFPTDQLRVNEPEMLRCLIMSLNTLGKPSHVDMYKHAQII